MNAIQHVLSLLDLPKGAAEQVLTLALAIKAKPLDYKECLLGKHLSLLFEKPSLRTRLSFETGFKALGGHVSYLSKDEVGLGKREAIEDVSRVISRYSDIVAIRTFKHEHLEHFAKVSTIPVINALTDLYHPCQALADVLSIKEVFGSLRGLKLCFVGDGNNVCRSLVIAAEIFEFDCVHCSPLAYKLTSQSSSYSHSSTLKEAMHQADVVYTDVWVSMGEETLAAQKNHAFSPYQVTQSAMEFASKRAVFMHCLPAHRGQEVSGDVFESAASIVFDQAENRKYAQQALLLYLLGVS